MTFHSWWKSWGGLTRKLVVLFASFASIGGVLVPFLPSLKSLPAWTMTLLILGVIAFVGLVVLEFRDHRGVSVYAKNDAPGIRRYMHEWIADGGRVAIWTRDMTWARSDETRQLLIKKAQQGELVLCLPEMNEFADELGQAGAEVCTYGAHLMEAPASRFTITYFGRAGSRVAVGRAEGDTHVINEFDAGHHPAFHLAADLVSVARALRAQHHR